MMEEEKTWDERNEGGDAELYVYDFIDSLRNRGNAKPTTTLYATMRYTYALLEEERGWRETYEIGN